MRIMAQATLFVVVVLIGVVVCALVVILLPPISRRAGQRRARNSGALWAGLAIDGEGLRAALKQAASRGR
ncbi:MAG: hypothetical protein LC792_28010 [Actinobacteria bacterium]|nr:hypothetical protein [Actinomycetota bacterium]